MSALVTRSGFVRLCKHSEAIPGDFHISREHGGMVTTVLSDGLGSGVKANILATLTAKILSTLVANGLPLEECVETMAQTLPVCKVRGLAYSTFTVLQMDADGGVSLAQFDNPFAVLLRDGKHLPYDRTRRVIGEKEVYESRFAMREGDLLVLMTDGVTSSGLGKTMPEGFPRQDVTRFLERWCVPGISAQRTALVLAEACRSLALGSPDDDTTVMVFQRAREQRVNLMIGPPEKKEDDEAVCRRFFSEEGKHIACGGTTAKTIAGYLGKPILPGGEDTSGGEIPATSRIAGLDLVTEGFLTLQRVLELARLYTAGNCSLWDIDTKTDGASLLAKGLFEDADSVHIFAGQAVNAAHRSGELQMDLEEKLGLVQRLKAELNRAGKRVNVSLT